MLVRFLLRAPGNYHEIGKSKMDSIPRAEEAVIINDEVHNVHSVSWNLTEMVVTVYLDE